MTNLYDLLRRIRTRGKLFVITNDELEWLDQYMAKPDHELHFKARKVGHNEQGDPIYAQDYAIAGEALEVFSLVTEAMLQNASFASLVGAAHSFYTKHVPTCPECLEAMAEVDPMDPVWKFETHKQV